MPLTLEFYGAGVHGKFIIEINKICFCFDDSSNPIAHNLSKAKANEFHQDMTRHIMPTMQPSAVVHRIHGLISIEFSAEEVDLNMVYNFFNHLPDQILLKYMSLESKYKLLDVVKEYFSELDNNPFARKIEKEYEPGKAGKFAGFCSGFKQATEEIMTGFEREFARFNLESTYSRARNATLFASDSPQPAGEQDKQLDLMEQGQGQVPGAGRH